MSKVRINGIDYESRELPYIRMRCVGGPADGLSANVAPGSTQVTLREVLGALARLVDNTSKGTAVPKTVVYEVRRLMGEREGEGHWFVLTPQDWTDEQVLCRLLDQYRPSLPNEMAAQPERST